MRTRHLILSIPDFQVISMNFWGIQYDMLKKASQMFWKNAMQVHFQGRFMLDFFFPKLKLNRSFDGFSCFSGVCGPASPSIAVSLLSLLPSPCLSHPKDLRLKLLLPL